MIVLDILAAVVASVAVAVVVRNHIRRRRNLQRIAEGHGFDSPAAMLRALRHPRIGTRDHIEQVAREAHPSIRSAIAVVVDPGRVEVRLRFKWRARRQGWVKTVALIEAQRALDEQAPIGVVAYAVVDGVQRGS